MVLLAHAGAGATWQAMLVLVSIGVALVVVGVASGRVPMDEPGDLVLPLAATAVLASLSGATANVVSDWVGWWFPAGVVALVGLVLASSTSLELSWRSPLAIAVVGLALASAVLLHRPIERAWHPVDGQLRDDVEIAITAPEDGATVAIGTVEVVVEVTGGSVGGDDASGGPDGPDPEEGGRVVVAVDGVVTTEDGRPVAPREDCSDGCTRVTFEVPVERGPHVVSAEFLTAQGESFATTPSGSPTLDLVTIAAE